MKYSACIFAHCLWKSLMLWFFHGIIIILLVGACWQCFPYSFANIILPSFANIQQFIAVQIIWSIFSHDFSHVFSTISHDIPWMLENHGKLGKNHGTIVAFPQSFHISSHDFPIWKPVSHDFPTMRPPCHANGTEGTVDMATLALDYWDDSQESEPNCWCPVFSKNWLGCMVYNYNYIVNIC